MMRRLVALVLIVACSSPPAPKAPSPPADDWGDTIRRFALMGLRAMVCEAPPPADTDTTPDP